MKARLGTLGLALALIALPALADDAKSRGSGGGGAAVGARHHSGGSGSGAVARGSGGSGGRYDRPGAVGVSSQRSQQAQARHPRAGTGTGWYRNRGGYYGRYPYYGGYYGYGRGYWGYSWGFPYYWDSGWGYPYYGYGYGYGYPYGYGRPYYYSGRALSSLRVIVDPNDTRVYVDGYYAGTSDDFDGIFQRLNVAPGRHEILLRKEGFKTHRFQVYAAEDRTLKLKYKMQAGEGEDPAEDLTGGREVAEEPRYDPERDLRERDRDAREPERAVRETVREPETGYLRLDVRPGDATVYVDGEFRGSARQADRLDLAPGRHRLEVVRPGYRTVEREIEVRPGRNEAVVVDLERS